MQWTVGIIFLVVIAAGR